MANYTTQWFLTTDENNQLKKNRIMDILLILYQPLKGIFHSFYGGSLETKLTVPLIKLFKKQYILNYFIERL